MVMDHGIIIFTPIFAVLIGFTVLRILKKRKRVLVITEKMGLPLFLQG